ncbi:MAG TPA: hypothetical protein VLM43_10140 [Desulfobacterales bacterium]|nr:hypothetical protein [Desulfobacterales bacterium]
MQITTQIDKSKDLTVFTVKGVLSFDNAMPVIKAFYEGDPTKHVVWDMTNITEVQLTSEEVIKIATFGPRTEGKREIGKTALVAHKDILFGLSRMFETHSDMVNSPYPVMVFRSIEQAYKWLVEP